MVMACAAPATMDSWRSPFGNLAKKLSRSASDEMPSYSPLINSTGQSTFAGSTTGRLDVMSRYVPVGTVVAVHHLLLHEGARDRRVGGAGVVAG